MFWLCNQWSQWCFAYVWRVPVVGYQFLPVNWPILIRDVQLQLDKLLGFVGLLIWLSKCLSFLLLLLLLLLLFFMMMMMGNVFKARHFGPTPCWMVLPTRTVHWVIPGLDTRTLREHTPRPSNQANPVWAWLSKCSIKAITEYKMDSIMLCSIWWRK